MKALVIAEHDHKTLALTTLNTISAARTICKTIDLLIIGKNCDSVAAQSQSISLINNVLLIDDEAHRHLLAENVANVVVPLAQEYSHILAPATTFGKNILPRVAAMLNTGMISDIIAIESPDIYIRPIYAGNALSKIKSLDTIKIISVRTTAFPLVKMGNHTAPLQRLAVPCAIFNGSTYIKQERTITKRPELNNARIIISGGRGLQKKENFVLIETLADCLHAAIGASRAAVDAGFVSNDLQVGQTGKIVAPDLYFAIGISGAIQHVAGIKDSKVIVAINKDPDAPIFQIADYGIVGDLFEIIPQLIEHLRKWKN
jgi:electron transfer flavoprotein alpha subunit